MKTIRFKSVLTLTACFGLLSSSGLFSGTNDASVLTQSLSKLGMPLYGAKHPTGYYWNEQTWLNSAALVSRMNFAILLSTNRLPGSTIDWDRAVQDLKEAGHEDAKEVERAMEVRLLGSEAGACTRSTVLSQNAEVAANGAVQMFNRPDSNEDESIQINGKSSLAPATVRIAGMAGLLLGSPEFQRR